MADLQEFEKALKDVLNSKRLSASKMDAMTKECMKHIENDVQLVSLLYRTHKTLPTSQKVFSLYAFDAVARAARHAVIKNNIVVDPMGTKGNCATFLNKVEGVLDSLIEDMLSSGQKELREKTKKIVDIWTANSTFSKDILTGLSAKVKREEDKAAALAAVPQSTTPPTAPPKIPIPSISPPANAAQAAGVQQALFALLSQATAAGKGSTPPNNAIPLIPAGAPTPAPTPAGLAIDAQRLLQQLAGQIPNQSQPALPAAAPILSPPAVPAAPSPPPKPMPIYAPNLPPPPDKMAAQRALGAVQMSPTADNSRFDNRPSGSRPSRWGDAHERSPPPRDDWDDRRGRGGGRGRGYSDRGDRGGWDRRGGRGRDHSPPPYGGRERSRSPPYRGGPGGARPFDDRGPRPGEGRFPPRRNSPVRNRSPPRYRSPPPRETGLMAQSMARTDEFGRDSRAGNERTVTKASEEAQLPRTNTSLGGYSNMPSTSSPPSSSLPAPIPAYSSAPAQTGLDKFDWSTFNFASPESWDALGRAFQVTNGHLPSQEEAMTIVMQRQMGGMMGGGGMGMQDGGNGGPTNNGFSNNGPGVQAWQNGGDQSYGYEGGQRGGRGRGRGRGGGRGGFGYGRGGTGEGGAYSGYQGQQGSFDSNQGGSWDGGQAWGASGGQDWNNNAANGYVAAAPPPSAIPVAPTTEPDDGESPMTKKHGGHMVKVGDRWQWVPTG